MISFLIHSDRDALKGWRYLWAKRVRGFSASVHCARCLVGDYQQAFGLAAPVNAMVELPDLRTGDLVYFCGVATPSRWANNLHLAMRVTHDAKDTASVEAWNGDTLTVVGGTRIPFDAAAAERDFAARRASYRSCRNFQFGAQMVAEGLL